MIRVPEKFKEILPRDAGCGGVGHGVAVDRFEVHQSLIENRLNLVVVAIVHKCECRNRSGCYTKHRLKQVCLAETQPCRADPLRQPLEVDHCFAVGDNKEQPAFGIFEKKVLGMAAWDLAIELPALLN